MRSVVIVALAALLLGGAAAAAPAPSPAPAGQADLYRDKWGVPHIYAAREADGFYALGYAQAEDSAQNLLMMSLAVEGRSAAAFGVEALPWSGSAANADKEALRWRIAEQSKAAYAGLSPRLKAQFDAYARGFNAYLVEHPEKKPAWAPQIEPWHALAWPHAILWFYNVGDGVRKCLADGIKMASGADLAHTRSASNEWAIGPARTAGGRTFLLSDPHGDIPIAGNPFYEYRMKAGGLDVTGYALGLLPALAHSPKVAWGLTTGGPDVSDCYKLKVEGGRYSLDGQWRDFEVRRHIIDIKGVAKVPVEFRYAEINGAPAPILGDKDGYAYAVSTPYWNRFAELFVQFDGMIRARDAESVLKAAEVQGMFPQNLLIADHKGSIIYVRGGRTPIRAPGVDWKKPLSGDDPASQWRGIHKLQDLVIVRNPPGGYLQNNNTLPDNMAKGPPLARAADYPGYIWNDNPALQYGDRAGRVNEVLDAAKGFTIEDAQRLSVDEKWYGVERWTALLAKAAEVHPEIVAGFDADARRVLDRLKTFDGFARKDSVAALNHHAWRSALVATYDKDRDALVKAVIADAPADGALKAALAAVPASVATLRKRLGSVDRPYGDWFRVGRSKDKTYPLGGGIALDMPSYAGCTLMQAPAYVCAITPRAFVFRGKDEGGPPLVTDGSRALRLVAMGPRFASYSVHNFGQSDDPTSPHWDDQARELTSQGKLRRVPFTPEELAREQTSHKRLVVK